MYAGLGLYAKRALTLADLQNLFAVGEESKTSGFAGRIRCAFQAIRILSVGRVLPWHIVLLKKLVSIHGLKSKSEQTTTEPPDKIIDRIACFLAASLGQTPEAVKSQTSSGAVDELVFQILQKEVDQKISLIRAEHDPKKFLEDIQSEYNRAKNKKPRPHGESKVVSISDIVGHRKVIAL